MRKNLFADVLGGEKLTPVNSDFPPSSRPAPLGSKGVVGAMSRALADISSDWNAARSGQEMLEIDAALIDGSIVRDRMPGSTADHQALVASVREHGQQVPVLLRPHPNEPDRYQIAYGHRRVDALREAGLPVRAVVRQLSDSELVVAQGQENSARRDLSYIERGTFGASLEDRYFSREVIMAALSVDKTELSRLINVARSVPPRIKETIGPAPKAGRRRWMELSERLSSEPALAALDLLLSDPGFQNLDDSDARFARVFEAAAPRVRRQPKAKVWTDSSGRKLVRIERAADRFTLSIDEKLEPAFGEYLLEQLPEILAAFQRREKD